MAYTLSQHCDTPIDMFNRIDNQIDVTKYVNGHFDKCIFWYRFERMTGTSVHDWCFKDNGASITGATWTPAGKMVHCLELDGNDDVLSGPTSFPPQLDGTISFWANIPAGKLTGVDIAGTAVKWDGVVNWNNIDWLIRCTDNLNIYFGVSTTALNRQDLAVPWAGIIKAGTWHLFAFIWKFSALGGATKYMKIYVDGVEVATVNTGRTPKLLTKDIFIGRDYQAPGGNDWFAQYMDEFQLYIRVLRPQEILNRYRIGRNLRIPPA